jgi:hypothetical protein
MAVTQADIDALNRAIASGERQVTHGNKSVTYRSISDLIAARDDLQRQLNEQAIAEGTTAPRPKQTRAYYGGRGY